MNTILKFAVLSGFLLISLCNSGKVILDANSNKYKDLPKGTVIYNIMNGDSVARTIVELPDSAKKYIVEFTESPLYASGNHTNLKSASLVNSQLQKIDKQHNQFYNDLSGLTGINSQKLKSKSLSSNTGQIGKEFRKVFNGVAVTADKNLIDRIGKLKYVKKVYPDNVVEAVDNESNQVIKADSVWTKYGATGLGVVIAIIDTGIDSTHQDLSHGKVIGGYDFVNDDNDPMDDHGHGTHCAGIAAANGPGLKGVAPDAKLLAVKVLSSGGSGYDSWIIAGIEYAIDPDGNPLTDDGADIISMSLGASQGNPNDPMSVAVNNAYKKGVLCVIAAGNDGSNYNTIGSPGCAREALTVGASDKSDNIAYFSSRGPALNSFEIKPNVLAPGLSIYSSLPDNKYESWSGTSMATPHIAGAAALLKQIHRDWNAQKLRSAIVHSAVDVNQGYDVWTQGNGRVDLMKAASVASSISKNSINFGLIPDSVTTYSKVDSFYVYNLSTSSLNYRLSIGDGLPSQITLGISPNQFTLAPSDSQLVVFSLDVDNSTLEYPSTPVQAYTGKIIIDDGIQPQNLLFSMIKSYTFTINFDFQPGFILIVSENGYSNAISPPGNSFSTLLSAGKYDVIVYYLNNYIVREQIDVATTHSIFISLDEAKFKVSFKGYGPDGSPLSIFDQSPERLVLKSDNYTGLRLLKFVAWDGYTVPPIDRNFSTISDRYRYEIAPMSYPHMNDIHCYFTVPFLLDRPLTNDTTISNDPKNFIKINFNHAPINKQYDSLYFTLSGFSSGIGGFYNLYDSFDTLTHILTPPFNLKTYIIPAPDRNFSVDEHFGYSLQKYHRKINPDNDTLVYTTPYYYCYKDSGGVYFQRGYLDQPQRLNNINGSISFDQNLSPLYKNGQVNISPSSKKIYLSKSFPTFIDQNYGTPVGNIFVTLSQGSTILEQDTLLNCYSMISSGGLEIPFEYNVDYTLKFKTMSYPVNKKTGVTFANYYFNIGTNPTWSDYLYSLYKFQLVSDGNLTNIFSAKKNNQIQFELSYPQYPKVKLFIKPLTGTKWKKFYEWNYSSDSNKYSFNVQIPDTLAANYYSLKLSMIASENDSLENIFDPAFCIVNSLELDSLALVDFYISTNGKNWNNNTNWLKTNVKNWYGVSVENAKIVGISLPNNNLTGSLPPSMKNLSDLTTLILNDNYLESIDDLTLIDKLTNVDVSNNLLTFNDVLPNLSISSLIYSPQRKLGKAEAYYLLENTSFSLNTFLNEQGSHYFWFKDSKRIADNDVPSISFKSLTTSDKGMYACYIMNENVPGLILETYPVTLDVKPPLFLDRSYLLKDLNVYSYGGAWIDYDNDGDQDLFIVNYSNCNQLLKNMLVETDSLWFKDVTLDAIGYEEGSSVSSTWGDINNDGFIDGFVVNQKYEDPRIIYLNNGDGTFRQLKDPTIQSQLRYSQTASFVDLDRDGYLDLFIGNSYHYLLSENKNQMFMNNKDLTFKNNPDDVLNSGIYFNSASWFDVDNDQDPDAIISSYGMDLLLFNYGDHFNYPSDSTTWLQSSANGLTNSVGDFNNDGYTDVFVAHGGWYLEYIENPHNTLYENHNGKLVVFPDSAITNDKTNYFSSSWGDFDNDGDLDLLGTSFYGIINLWSNQLQETGTVSFKKINYGATSEYTMGGRGCAFADFDNDGDLDIFVDGSQFENHLFENVIGSKNNWINIKCVGTNSNASAIGAKVKAKATINGKPCWQIREILAQTGYSGQNSLNVAFGFGNASSIDSIQIFWPSGYYWDTTAVSVNQFIKVIERQHPNDIPQIVDFKDTIAYENVPFSKTYQIIDNWNKGISISILKKPSWLTSATLGKSITFSGTPGDYSPGNYQITLSVTDGYITTPLIQTINVTVMDVNDPPVILGQSQITLNSNGKIDLSLDQLIVIDIDNDQSDLSLVILSGDHYSIENNTITVDDDYFDELKVKVQVSDGQSLSAPFELKIKNGFNDVPEISQDKKNLSATEDLYFESVISITDLKYKQITISSISNPDWITLSKSGDQYILSGTPLNEDTGLNRVFLSINDGYMASPVSDTLFIDVIPVDDAPVITGQKPLSINKDGYVIVKLSDLTVEDVDNVYPNNFSLILKPGTGYYIASDTVFQTSDNSLLVPVQVNDGELNSNSYNLTISDYVSVNNLSDPGCKVYPIPFSNVIYVNFSETVTPSKIEIFDLQGRKVTPAINRKVNYYEIDCNTLTQSIYLMKITTGNNTVVKKLIREI